ncbi:peptide MFS transporter [Fictibacillus sp. KIGAM418]|uniref:Peptide MFS transporter n=1 Tax=Fictibacillus marinisediminis TaxID=2878389 RepID=A0A9X1XB57_9BACL|nr:peptide MFS transporter [Fictibacillus marinisediminis]MCK6257464.1 peptide MFS transporter [Fictibacillus marinisediminis]
MEATVKVEQDIQLQTKKKHPPGLYLLFFTEMWERFSYYGMRAILVLYLTKSLISGGLGISDSVAMSIYGFFTGAVYFTPMIGGYLTDRFLGKRLAITIGGVTMAIGNLVLFANQSKPAFFAGLALLIIGNGFFKPNISTLVGDLYSKNDARKDAAFTIFYMGINIGAFFSPLIVGFLAEDFFKTTVNGVEHFGFKFGFLAAAIGMIIGQLLFNFLGNKFLGDIGKKPVGVAQNTVSDNVKKKPLTKVEKNRVKVIVILTFFVIFFMAGFEQAGSSLTLYTDKFIDRTVFGWTVPTSWFQSLNPLFIVIFAPIISILWVKLSKSKRGDLPTPTKMAIGMMLLGAGFAVLVPALIQTGTGDSSAVKANMIFMVLTYFLHTIGELCLQPVGLSMTSKLAPVKLASLMMGVWLAGSGFANILAGQLASTTESLGYFEVFMIIGGVTIFLGLILLSLSKKLVKMASE